MQFQQFQSIKNKRKIEVRVINKETILHQRKASQKKKKKERNKIEKKNFKISSIAFHRAFSVFV